MTRKLCALGLLCASSAPGMVSAQTNDELYSGLQFSFQPPGARSLAMGGAFAGRADDATTAYTNPAGLSWLGTPEVSAEIRLSDYTSLSADGTSVTGSPSGDFADVGNPFGEFDADTSGLSFLSYVIPKDDWAFAFYRHELANYELDIDGAQGGFYDNPTRPLGRSRTQALQARLDLDIVNWGVSGSYKLAPNFWLGAGVSYFDFDLDGVSQLYEQLAGESPLSAVNFTDAERQLQRTQRGNDEDFGGTVGLLWKTDDDSLSLGASYRSGPSFDFNSTFEFGPRVPNPSPSQLETARRLSGGAQFDTPDTATLGLSWRPIDSLTLMFDVAHVKYSNLEPSRNVLAIVRNRARSQAFVNDPTLSGADLDAAQDRIEQELLNDFQIDDATEIRVGVEYVYVTEAGAIIAFRGGAWRDPDHQLTYVGALDAGATCDPGLDMTTFDRCETNRIAVQRQALEAQGRFTPGDDETHITGGIGVVLQQGFSLDFGFDISDRSDIYSLSAIWRF